MIENDSNDSNDSFEMICYLKIMIAYISFI